MIIKKELIKRESAGETVLVPVGKAVYDANGLFVMNELGAFLWDRLGEADSIQSLTAAVLEHYEVDEATAKADIEEFLEALRKLDVI